MKEEFCKHFTQMTDRALYADSYGCQSFTRRLVFLPPRIGRVFLLHYVVSGMGTLTIGDKAFPLKAGALFYCPVGLPITYHSSKTDPYEYYWITFGGTEAEKLMADCGFTPDTPVIYPARSEQIMNVMSELIEIDAGSMRTLSALYEVLDLSQLSGTAPPPDYAQKAADVITANFTDSALRIADVAHELHLSPEYLSKVFHERMGCSAKTYLTDLRLKNAAALLRNGASVTQAAEKSGYDDLTLFSRTFKQKFGVPPRLYN